ncbi:MAG TPA: LemA family protein [Pirellulales bacterium]|jgi:LemA protein|nr:LemA family protein [Pirellulales bacterium]
MKPMQVFLGILAVVVLIAAGIGMAIFSGYNRAIRLDEAVKQQWAQVQNQLQRRYDLIPNLQATVKGTAGQEQKVFLGIAEARKAYFQYQKATTVDQQAAAAGQIEGALSRLLVLRESYPELKSNESFMKLQDALEGTENRVAVERGRYNDAVQQLNQSVRQFPGSLYASLAGVKEAQYFQVETAAKTPPKVDFSDVGPKTEQPAKP